MQTKAIIFDLGGVLINWDPHLLYRQLFDDEQEMMDFLANIATMDWNEEQDMGRPLQQGTDLLVSQYPAHEANIRAYYTRWEEMLGGAIEGTLKLFKQIKASRKFKIYALSNWSAETLGIAQRHYEFLNWFDGMVVSGLEKTRKPFPDFYNILLNRYSLKPQECLFIDDNYRNILAAEALDIPSIHFTGPDDLQVKLNQRGII